MSWLDSFNPREQGEIAKARAHSPHLYDVNCISFLVEINSGTAMEIITKMAELLDKLEATLTEDGYWDEEIAPRAREVLGIE